VSSHKPPKDREAEQQRWAERQEATADLLRETLDAAGARAAEISDWLDSSLLSEEAEPAGKEPPRPVERPVREGGTENAGNRPENKGSPAATRQDEHPSREGGRTQGNNSDRARS
jgi:hypothetical protein